MSAISSRHVLTASVALACLGLAGCGGLRSASTSVANVVTPYRIEIVQGNFVSKEQVAYLQPGASRTCWRVA
ncbi:MAG: outer membrane protein assembly factor BamE, partial [Rubrivivax sp.]